ncbi:MAG: hypothetical protein AAF497_08105, partial [Planctomycetota bacterium]
PSKVCSFAAKNMRWPMGTPEQLGYYVQSNEAPPGASKTILFNDLFFHSRHLAVVNFGKVDGSVDSLSKDTDFKVLQMLATRDGGEVGPVGCLTDDGGPR